MLVIVRQLERAHIQDILRIQREAYVPELHEPASSFEEKLSLFPRGALGCWKDGLLAGYAVSLPWRGDDVVPLSRPIGGIPSNPDTLFLHDVAVANAGRGMGIAPRLVDHVFALADEIKTRRIALVAVQESELFWGRFGFRRVEAIPYATTMPAIKMLLVRPAPRDAHG